MSAGPGKTFTVDATGQTNLGEAVPGGVVSSWAIEFISSSFSGSVTIRAKSSFSTQTTYQAKGYKDQTTDTVATAAITGNALVLVDSTGLDVQIDCASYTSGDLIVTATPHRG